MSARELASMVTEALRNGRKTFLEWLENEDYAEIEDEICEWLSAE